MTRSTSDARRAARKRIDQMRGSPSICVSDVVGAIASQYGVDRSTVWRWAAGHGIEERTPKALTRAHLEVIARYDGNLKAAYRELHASGEFSASYSTFTRRLRQVDTDIAQGVLHGIPAALGHSLYAAGPETRKLEVVAFDHTEIPVNVLGPRGQVTKPWISVLVDHATRLLLSVVITYGDGIRADPGTESVRALAAGALLGHDMDGHHVGGLFRVIRCDNAKAHLADAIVQGYAALGIVTSLIRPGSPWENGRAEALVSTFEEELFSTLPGYVHHNPTRYGRSLWQPDDLLTAESLALRVDHYAADYNTRRPHAGLDGRTPLQAWIDDPSIVEDVDPGLVRHGFMAEARPRKINHYGIEFRRVTYIAPEFKGKVGRRAQVRFLPNDRSFIDVYIDGEFLATATPAATQSVEDRARIARIKTSRMNSLSQLQKQGAQRALADEMRRADVDGIRRPRTSGDDTDAPPADRLAASQSSPPPQRRTARSRHETTAAPSEAPLSAFLDLFPDSDDRPED